jgi:hypothetical protein
VRRVTGEKSVSWRFPSVSPTFPRNEFLASSFSTDNQPEGDMMPMAIYQDSATGLRYSSAT